MTAPSRIESPDRFQARGLRRAAAAAYVGVSPTKFNDMVSRGCMPKPRVDNGSRIWDRLELDEAFSALPHVDQDKSKPNPWDDEEAA